MIAVTKKTVADSMDLAVAYLSQNGYEKVKKSWLRGPRHAAVLEASPTGRVIVKEGVTV
ncbi:hypothetical protein [Aeromonas hydrophila]|uniref:hypothetical protein n=1 Tax=Aeromonas hydrophila TaxID=644 RepID=UPI003D25D2DD